ncbi:hypothetical protein T265_07384 [Opisthorchis viverrini]|uniref:Hyaluronan/mRNA-binding protein domain-containing protein n=1 Tax=Opisthorchis viverrini TaxID=6198 RepID=A0A075ABR2_OPIVI|nr:hypothetical protein T265_07384 [Opisthorchis viverrini]KER25094.1 hypothetical protein T265_07384 [Opisthorchis viverrini]
MAGVDHAYQYSVEVKSRFSLFLDDPLSNEDPDLLQNRILNQRQERKKKDKPVTAVEEPKLADSLQENEVKPDDAGSKVKGAGTPKQTKTSQASVVVTPSEPVSELPSKTSEEHMEPSAPRGRGAPRGFARGMRSRGLGPRGFNEGPPAGDFQTQSREMHFEPRGRGRGRGGFSRGRGSAYTDHREFDRSVGSDRVGPRAGYQKEAAHFADQPTEGDNSQQAPAPEGGDVERSEVEDSEKHEELVNGEAEPAEEEPKTLTLEEYKALRSSTKPTVALASKGTRKANDGKDVFANMVPHRKINEVSDEEVEEVEKEPEEEPVFEINVSFTDRFSERGRGSYGGRGAFDRGRGAPGFRGNSGRPRGGRGARSGFRGAPRGRGFARGMGFEHQVAPPIYSDQDFPTLK